MGLDTRLAGQCALVTGANTGIGAVTAVELARRGAHVWLACRSEARAGPVLQQIRREVAGARFDFLALDLSDFDSVSSAAERFLRTAGPLHLLVNNAGVAGQRGLTHNGFELTFGVNHLGHFLLTGLLLGRLQASAPARIINVSSVAAYSAKAIDFAELRRPTGSRTGLPEYAVSKLANVLFTRELARRLSGTGVTAYALHPGVIASDIWRHVPWPIRPLLTLFMSTNEEGAKTTLHCATAPELAAQSGLFYEAEREKAPPALALDEDLARRLWEQSELWTDLTKRRSALESAG